MKKYYNVLKDVLLFEKIDENELMSLLKCLSAKKSIYTKNSMIVLAGDDISQIGIVLSGNIQILKEDLFGNRTILTELSSSDVFLETFVCSGITKSPVTVLATTTCEILYVNYKKITTTCSSSCIFHTVLIENMLKLIANKNLMLNQKIEIISKRTTREKLISYFNLQIKKSKSKSFVIPFKREEFADFLCVDRSAMSRELSKMRDEGIIQFKGSSFEVLKP